MKWIRKIKEPGFYLYKSQEEITGKKLSQTTAVGPWEIVLFENEFAVKVKSRFSFIGGHVKCYNLSGWWRRVEQSS